MHVGGIEILIVLVVVVLLFGSGKISALLGDLARGLKTFKKTMNEPDVEPPAVSLPAGPPREPEEPGGHPTPGAR